MQKRLFRERGTIRKIILVCLSGVLLPRTVPAQSQSPPKPPAAETDVFASDARLQQGVAVHAEGVPVGDLLTLLAQKTGVTLKADLYVADDKVIVFNPARPLRDTLRDIAALFNDEWQVYAAPERTDALHAGPPSESAPL